MLTNSLQHPGAPLTNFNVGGGGSDGSSYFIPQKITTSEFVCPKKNHYFFLVYPKRPLVLFSQPKKIPLFFFATQNNPGVFHRPKKITFGKISDPKKSSGFPPSPPVIKICEWSPWAPARCATVKTRIKVEGRVVRVIVHPPTTCFARLAPNEECEESRKRSFRCICFLKRQYFK